jgi:hypothetical protein
MGKTILFPGKGYHPLRSPELHLLHSPNPKKSEKAAGLGSIP